MPASSLSSRLLDVSNANCDDGPSSDQPPVGCDAAASEDDHSDFPDNTQGRPSSTQLALTDPPAGAAPVYCPECSLLLVGKVAALMPCGHVHHSHCAEYLTRMARSRGGLCGHCKFRVTGRRVLHLCVDEGGAAAGGDDGGGDAATLSGERLAQVKAEIADVAKMQKTLMEEDRRARDVKRRDKDLQHQCAALYQQNEVLRRAVASAFGPDAPTATTGNGVGPSVAAIVAATTTTGSGGGAARDPTGFALDPLTSIVQLQQHVMDCADAERALAGSLARVGAETAALGQRIEGYRADRQRLEAEKALLRRRLRRRQRLSGGEAVQHQRPAPPQPRPLMTKGGAELLRSEDRQRPSPVKVEPGCPTGGVGGCDQDAKLGERHPSTLVVVLSSDDGGSSESDAEGDESDSDVLVVAPSGDSSHSRVSLPTGPVRPASAAGAAPTPGGASARSPLVPGGLPRPRFGEVPRPRPQQRLL